jgi:hypothetical protein
VHVDGGLSSPGRRHEEAVEGVGELGAPGGGVVGHGGRHGQVLRVAGSVAADKGQDEEGGSEVENEGYEERDENALYDISGGVAAGRRRVALTLRKCRKAAMVQNLLRRC